jgi:hypothetical protein
MFVADAGAGFRLAPGFRHESTRFSINSIGLRDRERSAGPPPQGVLRVAVLGDSYAAGSGVPDGRHVAALLEEAIPGARPGGWRDPVGAPPPLPKPVPREVEVWNLAVPHHGTEQTLSWLDGVWDRVQPHVAALFFFLGNDPWDNLQGPGAFVVREGMPLRRVWAPWPGSPYNAERAELNRPLPIHHVPGDGLLQRHSQAWRWLLAGISSAAAARRGARPWPWDMAPFDYEAFGGVAWLALRPEPPPVLGAWRITRDLLRRLRDRLAARGVPLLLFGIPTRLAVQPEELAGAERSGWRGALGGGRHFDLAAPGDRLRKIAEELEIPFVDLLPVLRGAGPDRIHFENDSHWTVAGHRAAALALGEELARRGFVSDLDPLRLREQLFELVPPGSVSEVLVDPARARAPGAGEQPAGGRAAFAPAAAPPEPSEALGLLLPAESLLPLLPPAPPGWTRSASRAWTGPLPPPRQEVWVAQAEARYRDAEGRDSLLRVVDGGGQPEIDGLLRELGSRARVGPRAAAICPSCGRILAILEGGDRVLLDSVDPAALDAAEDSQRPPAGDLSAALIATSTVGGAEAEPRVPPWLHDPRALVPSLPEPPPGWQAGRIQPVRRPHQVPQGMPPPPEILRLLDASVSLRRPDAEPWTAQVKRWYRGPEGPFEVVVQDSGRDARLLRWRASLLAAAWDPGGSRPAEPGWPAPQPFDAPPLRGFRVCREVQGVCKVVVPLVDPAEPDAPLARFNAIVLGPPQAGDGAWRALVLGIRRDLLPEETP